MTTATLPVRASLQANADRCQRLAYDGLEAMRIAETHLKAMRDYCDQWEFDKEDWAEYYTAADVPYWCSAVRLLITNLEHQCYGPPTMPDSMFKAMASIENIEDRNMDGMEAVCITLAIASHQMEEARIICKDADLKHLLMASIIVVDMVRGFADGVLIGGDVDERIAVITGKPLSRH